MVAGEDFEKGVLEDYQLQPLEFNAHFSRLRIISVGANSRIKWTYSPLFHFNLLFPVVIERYSALFNFGLIMLFEYGPGDQRNGRHV